MKIYKYLWCFISLILASCSDNLETGETPLQLGDLISISGEIAQVSTTRVNDSGFCDGDQMGVFIVDYANGAAGMLAAEGNHADNIPFVLNSDGRWIASSPVYWKDKNTSIDVYGYYPYTSSIESVTNYSFIVEADQSKEGNSEEMSNYEKSDFLWAKATNVQSTTNPIQLQYGHRMAGIKVVLQQGTGFQGEEWNKVSHVVSIAGTQRKAVIDLATGDVTADGTSDKNIKAAPQGDDVYRAVIVPQTTIAGKALIGMTIDGVAYHYTPSENITFSSGKMYTFTLKVDKRESGDYVLTFVSKSIADWENDASSHNFETAAYTIIDCPQEGSLEQCIAKTGKDAATILNLKITGRINSTDFQFIREKLSLLQGLNLKEVVTVGYVGDNRDWDDYFDGECHNLFESSELLIPYSPTECVGEMNDVLPQLALKGKKTLKYLVLPQTVKFLGNESLAELSLSFNSTLVIPNSVVALGERSLYQLEECNLIMPDSLIAIGKNAMSSQTARYEIKLPETLKHIGSEAFYESKNVTGHFSLPSKLTYIGMSAFAGFGKDLTGDIVIPNSILKICDGTFGFTITGDAAMGFKSSTNVVFHDNVEKIGTGSFRGLTINNYVKWPSKLKRIATEAFGRCNFRGGMAALPSDLSVLGERVFIDSKLPESILLPSSLPGIPNWFFRGSTIQNIEVPESAEFISDMAFSDCRDLKSVTIGKYVDEIGNQAFEWCEALRNIVCLSPEPPRLGNGVFDFCDFDHMILEVPEQSVMKYRNAEGWNKIKYITAHHELATSIRDIKCLDKGISLQMIVRSEGDWEITKCPSWCHVSQMSSNNRTTEVIITVDESSLYREDIIEFSLKGKNYTSTCKVEQYVASQQEDKEIILQNASSGMPPIPLFIVGDGFTAKQVADGTYLERCKEQMEYFFSIEPYKTYRDYFTVSTALAVSPEQGISTAEYEVNNKFETTDDPEVGYRCDYNTLKNYAIDVCQEINESNIDKTLIMVVMNQTTFGGNTYIAENGMTVSFNSISPDAYPFDTRGLVQYYAGGLGFGRLANEQVIRMDYIKNSAYYRQYQQGKAKGWYQNVSTSNTMNTIPWKHLVFDSRYSDIVDMYEGGFYHSRGVFRSEHQSCMSDYIQYYNTWSRELIVRRIMELVGKPFVFEEFVSRDSRDGIQE